MMIKENNFFKKEAKEKMNSWSFSQHFLNLSLLIQKQDVDKDKYLYLFKSGMLDSYSNMLITSCVILDNLFDLFET